MEKCATKMSTSIKINATNCTLPNWLTVDYITDALQSYYKISSLRIIEVNIENALASGENFGSTMYRVRVLYTNNERDTPVEGAYVLKIILVRNVGLPSDWRDFNGFKRELCIYDTVLPKLTAILRKCGETHSMFAPCIKVDHDNLALFLEDLSVKGIKVLDRHHGLDIEHAHLLLCKLAKLHAASLVINNDENGALEHYDRGFFNRHTEVFRGFFLGNAKACVRMLKRTSDMLYYAEKLERLMDIFMQLGLRVFNVQPEKLNVLCHGDIWVNNMMFAYDDRGVPIHVYFLDWQCTVWTTPAVDLHYFLNTSLQEDLRLNKQHELVQLYHKTLLESAKLLEISHIKLPSLFRFHLDMEEKLFYAVISSCSVQPLFLSTVTETADFDGLMGENARAITYKDNVYKNERVLDYLRVLLPKFESLGLLDMDQ